MLPPKDVTKKYREALSSYATGVTVVTARRPSGEPIGMTASSFNGVSLNPPLVLWSVSKTAFSAQTFCQTDHYAIHVLSEDQVDLCMAFGKAGNAKFASVTTTDDNNGVPCIPDVACRFDCERWAVYEGGDHWIIVGEVKNYVLADRPGLIFSGGEFARTRPF